MIPGIEITDVGLVAPPREDITAALWDMMREAFGSNLNEDPRTPQGQFVTSMTAALQYRYDEQIELGNNFDPRYAAGQFQEALGAVYFLRRKQAVSSVAQLEFIGVNGTVVPAGFIVMDDAGREWRLSGDYTVGDGLAEAVCVITGPVQAAPDTITQIKEALPGLDRVSNPAAAAVGHDVEDRYSFERRRYESVAANSWGLNASVRGAVDNLTGVIDTYVIDNPTDNSITVGNTSYPMIRNSLLVSVVGGDDYEIAEQVLHKGGTGCAFVGNTEVLYTDEETGNLTHPEYLVRFLRPSMITVQFRLIVMDRNAVSYQLAESVKNHIAESFQSGENRGRIGGMVIGSAYMCGLDQQALRPVKIEISRDGGSSWHEFIQFGVDEFPTTSPSSIEVVGL